MRGKRMTIYVGETDKWHHQSLYMALLERLRAAGCAGATVTRGIAGFGPQSHIKTTMIEVLAIGLPVVITVVDRSDQIERVLPEVAAMVAAGVVTVDDTEVYFYSAAFKGGLPDVPVGEVMRLEPEAVTPETSLAEVVERLVAREYTVLPVVDQDCRVVGVIGDSDLLRAGATPVSVSLHKATGPEFVRESLAKLKASGATVATAMTSPAVTTTPAAALKDAAHLMHTRNLKRLPVVDENGRLVGVLGRLDVLTSIASGYARRTVPPPHQLPQEHRTVEEIMERQVPTVSETTPLFDVVGALLASDVKRVLVLDAAGKLAGIITDTDIVARTDPSERPGLLTLLRSRWNKTAAQQVRRTSGQRAADVMTTPVVTVHAGSPVIEALAVTANRHVKRLPVVDSDGRIVGMVSRPALLGASLDLTGPVGERGA